MSFAFTLATARQTLTTHALTAHAASSQPPAPPATVSVLLRVYLPWLLPSVLAGWHAGSRFPALRARARAAGWSRRQDLCVCMAGLTLALAAEGVVSWGLGGEVGVWRAGRLEGGEAGPALLAAAALARLPGNLAAGLLAFAQFCAAWAVDGVGWEIWGAAWRGRGRPEGAETKEEKAEGLALMVLMLGYLGFALVLFQGPGKVLGWPEGTVAGVPAEWKIPACVGLLALCTVILYFIKGERVLAGTEAGTEAGMGIDEKKGTVDEEQGMALRVEGKEA